MSKHRAAGEIRTLTYFPAIDGLRTLAVIGVVAFHSYLRYPGYLGVDIFFVISGFVITLTLIREFAKSGTIKLRNFYLRRAWRLTPALLAAVLFGAVVEGLVRSVSVWTFAKEAFWSLTYTYNFYQVHERGRGNPLNHLWSLSIEEQFYLLWAPALSVGLVLLPAWTTRLRSVFIAALAFTLVRIVTALCWGSIPAFFFPWCRVNEFLVGAGLAVALQSSEDCGTRFKQFLAQGYVGLAAALALLVATVIAPAIFSMRMALVGFLCVALATGALVGHLHVSAPRSAPGITSAVLSSRPLVYVGRRSYGVYLYHFPLIVAMRTLGVSPIPMFVLALGGAVLVASISFKYLENPLRNRSHQPVRSGMTSPAMS